MSLNSANAVGRKPAGDMVGKPVKAVKPKEEKKKFKIEVPLISIPTETFQTFTRLIMYGMMGYLMISVFTSAMPFIQQLMPLIGLMLVMTIPALFMTLIKRLGGD